MSLIKKAEFPKIIHSDIHPLNKSSLQQSGGSPGNANEAATNNTISQKHLPTEAKKAVAEKMLKLYQPHKGTVLKSVKLGQHIDIKI